MATKRAAVIFDLEAKEALQTVGRLADSFEGLEASSDQSLGKLRQQMERAADGAKEYGEALEKLNKLGVRSTEQIKEEIQELERLEQAFKSDAVASGRLATQKERLNQELQGVSRSGGTASQIIFGLGDAAEDAQFGLRGAANNIGFVAEQFVNLSQTGGGARAALTSVGAAIAGPAGIVLAIQALLAYGPKLLEFFSGTATEVDKLTEALQEAADGMVGISEDFGEFELQTLRAAEAVRNRLVGETQVTGAVLDDLRELDRLLGDMEQREGLEGLGAGGQRVNQYAGGEGPEERIRQLRTQLDLEGATRAEVAAYLDQYQQLLSTQEGIKGALEEQIVDLERQRMLAAELRRLGIYERQSGEAAPGVEMQGMIRTPLRMRDREFGALPEFSTRGAGGGPDIDQAFDEYGRLQNALDIDPDGAGLRQAQALYRTIMDLAAAGEITGEAFSFFKEELKTAGLDMDAAAQKGVNLGQSLEQGLAQMITSAASAIGSGENVAVALIRTLAGLAQQVGTMMIGFGTAALKLQTLLTNPVAAIAAGAALVALGAAAKATIGGTVSRATGGSGQGTTYQGRASIEGGGTGGIQVGGGASAAPAAGSPAAGSPAAGIPGFAGGVDLFGGGLAMVGERGRELAVLPPLSNVLTNQNTERLISALSRADQMQQATRRPGVTVNSSTNVTTRPLFDRFDLVTFIEETQDIRDDLAR